MLDVSPTFVAPLTLLLRALPGLPTRLREVGQFLADHEFDATTRSMRGLATEAGINPASFTRLAQALGYTGWDALRDALIETRRSEAASPFSGRVRQPLATPRSDPAGIAAAMVETDAVTTDALAHGQTVPEISRAALALHRAERVWVAGFRSCRGVAALLLYQLRLFRPDTARLVGGAGPEDLDFGAFRSGDAVVVIGFHPYSRDGVTTAAEARKAGCTVIAVVDHPAAPIAEGAAHLLRFDAAAGPGFFPSLTGAMTIVQALAASAFAFGGQAALTRLRETEARLAAQSHYVPIPPPSGPETAST